MFFLIATSSTDVAYGVFALFNTIIYFVWAIILFVHRATVILDESAPSDAHSQDDSSVNPTFMNRGYDEGEGYGNGYGAGYEKEGYAAN